MVKKGFTSLKNGTWEEYKETFKEKMKASEWTFDRVKEAFDLVAKDEFENMSIVQEIMLKVRTTCGESLRPSQDKEVSQSLTRARIATVSLWKTTFDGTPGENIQVGGAQFVEKSTIGSNRTGSWSYKQRDALRRMRYRKAGAQI